MERNVPPQINPVQIAFFWRGLAQIACGRGALIIGGEAKGLIFNEALAAAAVAFEKLDSTIALNAPMVKRGKKWS